MNKAFGFENSSIYFLLNNKKLGRNDLTKIKENWCSNQITIEVIEERRDILQYWNSGIYYAIIND